ncbi:LysR family transcriptional regulator [Rahnella sp. CG8]|uniref:LysR family transcriptional regulator n=1 Tax=Yersiniaceae TaxID=1903411 RepID=UPI001013CC67|nr:MULTISPECIES: LysR family transcriptional regulator [Yersiniaceae]MCM2446272.1 LysR family transcriptional regulator [Rahnella sp. CG8]
MRIRHLRYFLVVAEELSFVRASERVHIERSSLAHAIHDLEGLLGVRLFNRSKGGIRLTWSGEVLLDDVRQMLTFFEYVQSRVQAASNGSLGRIRIGLSDSLAQPRLTSLLAKTREEEPSTQVRITEMTADEMLRALHHDQIDIGITVNSDPLSGYIKHKVWGERPAVAIPTHHPLLASSKVTLREVKQFPLILFHPVKCAGGFQVVSRWFCGENLSLPTITEYASGHEQMLMLVAAGYGIGIGLTSQLGIFAYPNVIVRPLHEEIPDTTTYFITQARELDPTVARFIQRAGTIDNPLLS